MDGVELVFTLQLLIFHTLSAMQSLREIVLLCQCCLAVDIAQQAANDRALTSDDAAHALELPDMGIPPYLAIQP